MPPLFFLGVFFPMAADVRARHDGDVRCHLGGELQVRDAKSGCTHAALADELHAPRVLDALHRRGFTGAERAAVLKL